MGQKMKKYLKLLRTKHYVKNLLIFLPAFLGGEILNVDIMFEECVAFVIFSLTASIVYIVNDLRDLDNDRKHPTKRNRPLASGEISKKNARVLICILVVLITLCLFLSKKPLCMIGIPGIYFLINVLYSFGLKKYALVDVCILMLCYLLRLEYGGVVTGIGVSTWMFLTMMSASFFLGFGKRRNELRHTGDICRSSLKQYSVKFLDQSLVISMTMTIVFYALTCADKNSIVAKAGVDLLWSVPVAVVICFRYLMLIEDNECDGDPVSIILGDKMLLILACAFCVVLFILLYSSKIISIILNT